MQAHQGLLIFLIAMICAHNFPMLSNYHPFTLLELAFKGIAQRVYRPSYHHRYQLLSGALAFTLPLVVLITLLMGLSLLAFPPQWLGGLILYLCLDTQTTKRAKRIAILLNQQQKATARQLLSIMVNRDVTQLSSIGITKACIDSTVLRLVRHYYLIVIFYLLGGPIMALSYKLLLIFNHAWRNDLKPNSPFMIPLNSLLAWIEWLPIRGFIGLVALSLNFKKVCHYLKNYAHFFHQRSSGWILSLFAANLNVQLGGPCIYHGEKFNKMRIGSERHPDPDDIETLLVLLKRIWVFSILCLLLAWLIYIALSFVLLS